MSSVVTKKQFVLNYLSNSQDEAVFDRVEKFINFYDPQPMTWEEYRNRIDESLKAIDEGREI